MALILFSTIGFNIIVSFCGGCESEHVDFVFSSPEPTTSCQCCDNSDKTFQCCNSEAKHENEHHQTKNILAQLKFDSTEAKSKILKVVLPVITFHSIVFLLNAAETALSLNEYITELRLPPSSGRSILRSICVLRN
jgi:hypothetical protein